MGVRIAIEMEHLVSKKNTVLFNDLPSVSKKNAYLKGGNK